MSSFHSLCNLYLSVNICLKMLLKMKIQIIQLGVCINICNYTKECIGLQKVSAFQALWSLYFSDIICLEMYCCSFGSLCEKMFFENVLLLVVAG